MSEWLPIETAPKDGTGILCFAPGNKTAIFQRDMVPVIRLDHHSDEFKTFAHMRPSNPYTHWQPLPQPPKDNT